MRASNRIPQLAPPIAEEQLEGGARIAFHIVPLLRTAFFNEKDESKKAWIKLSLDMAIDNLEYRTNWKLEALRLP
jgi:hypothetical protein